MYVTAIKLKHWRNFKTAEVSMRDKVYLLGPNASGKSNFLDVFRFLRDVSKPSGGGLQRAVEERGGIKMLRCLHARQDPEVSIEVELSETLDAKPKWRYLLAFRSEGKGKQRLQVSKEEVWRIDLNKQLLKRPDNDDKKDMERLTQTHLEQINTNAGFREITKFFESVTYLHLVPQLLKYGKKIGGQQLDDDPFGQGFLERVARATESVRSSRLHKIQKTLTKALPQFNELKFEQDSTGRPHLSARYEHYRPNAGWTREEHFSDGTLRLIALLWLLLDNDSLLLLEEPELSLNDAIVKQIPNLFSQVEKNSKAARRQIIVSTHSEALLSSRAIDARGILLLSPSREGTEIRQPDKREEDLVRAGISVGELFLPKIAPSNVEQMQFY